MLMDEPEKRLSAVEALRHQVFEAVWGDDVMTEHNQA